MASTVLRTNRACHACQQRAKKLTTCCHTENITPRYIQILTLFEGNYFIYTVFRTEQNEETSRAANCAHDTKGAARKTKYLAEPWNRLGDANNLTPKVQAICEAVTLDPESTRPNPAFRCAPLFSVL